MTQRAAFFISEVSSNHAQDLDRCRQFIEQSARIGCDAVKFQLFRLEELFAPEILATSEEHSRRKQWELPLEFLPKLAETARSNDIQFSCTPFYLDAVGQLYPFVDFYKIASYELLWDDLIAECARTGKPLVLSTGMATLQEIKHAADVFKAHGGTDLTLLHCVSAYPTPPGQCNLQAIETIRDYTGCKVGWSDHSRHPGVVARAVHRWQATMIEFHLDIEGKGAEFEAGHCWLPDEIEPVIAQCKAGIAADGDGRKEPVAAELSDRDWRADPADGLRPLKHMRQEWQKK